MKQVCLFLVLISVVLLPAFAEDKKASKAGDGAPQMDEATKAEFDAARKKFESAKAELDAVMEKVKGGRPEGEKRGDMATLPGQVEMLKQQLAFTDEQYKKVKELAEKVQKEMDARVTELKTHSEALDAERAKDTPDFNRMRELMEKRARVESENMIARFKFMFDAKPLVTAEQFGKWKDMMKKMEERMKAGREKMAGGAPKDRKGE